MGRESGKRQEKATWHSAGDGRKKEREKKKEPKVGKSSTFLWRKNAGGGALKKTGKGDESTGSPCIGAPW